LVLFLIVTFFMVWIIFPTKTKRYVTLYMNTVNSEVPSLISVNKKS